MTVPGFVRQGISAGAHTYMHACIPTCMHTYKEENREKSYHNWLKVQASKLWLQELTLLTLPSAEPGRMPTYVRLDGTDLSRISLYKPAPYLRQHHVYIHISGDRRHEWNKV